MNLNPAAIIRKGTQSETDSYSAIFDNHREHRTGLEDWLKNNDIWHLVVAGLATDFCVLYTVKDALELGLTVAVYQPGCRALNLEPGDEEKAIEEMKKAGAAIREQV